MYTITLREAKKRLKEILKEKTMKGYYETWKSRENALNDLIELAYKSGKHDGWYDCQEKHKKVIHQ